MKILKFSLRAFAILKHCDNIAEMNFNWRGLLKVGISFFDWLFTDSREYTLVLENVEEVIFFKLTNILLVNLKKRLIKQGK